ncbi:MAG: MBOAT family O-acyltransferase [Bilophila sp.]
MNFVTLEFAVFLLFVLTLGWLLKDRPRLYATFVLLCNLLFYASAGLFFVPLLLTVAVLNWGTARLLTRYSAQAGLRKLVITIDIVLHVLLLGFFKYYELLVLGLESLLSLGGLTPGTLALPMTDILFPVGLSFYTFQGLSYAIDQYRTPDESPQSLGNVLLFVSFFPTVMAGPILRAGQFFPQFGHPNSDPRALQEGFALILSGLFKKVVLASYLSEHIVRDVFQSPEAYSSWAVLAAVYAYSIQIFCDFSGYSDMAIGVGRLMGYKLPDNFRSPYLALNLQDFWRRWHITLSLWLRDYLYIPLGGNRKGSRALNLIITMSLGGLWHGSHTRFLVWGLLHGLGLAGVQLFQHLRQRFFPVAEVSEPTTSVSGRMLHGLGVGCAWLLTFHVVSFLWVFFRAEDMERSLEILRRVFWFGQPGEGFALMVIPAILIGLLVQVVGRPLFGAFVDMQERLPWPLQAITLALLGGMILHMGPDGVMPFIYFQF